MIVPDDDLQGAADGESDQRHKRILEPHTIDVICLGAGNEVAYPGVASQEPVDNGALKVLRPRHNLHRRAGTLLWCRWFDVRPNNPAREPAGCNLIHGSSGMAVETPSNRLDVDLVCYAEVLEALTNTPRFRTWVSVELRDGEALRERPSTRVGRIELRPEAKGPRRN